MFLFRFRSFVGPAHGILRSAYVRGRVAITLLSVTRKE